MTRFVDKFRDRQDFIDLIAAELINQYRRADSEFIHRTIYGSQLSALWKIVEGGPLKTEKLLDDFHRHEILVKSRHVSLYKNTPDWMDFLIRNDLVKYDGSYQATDRGRTLINYFINNGVTPSDFPF